MIDGGDDATDLLDYSSWFSPVQANLGDTMPATDPTTGTGGVQNVEQVIGGLAADTIVGNSRANRLYGGAGNDVISGGDGNDFIDGQTGNDTLNGEGGEDFIVGGDGNDLLDGGLGRDVLFGGSAVGSELDYDRNTLANFELPLDWAVTEDAYSSSTGANFGRLPTLDDPIGAQRDTNRRGSRPLLSPVCPSTA